MILGEKRSFRLANAGTTIRLEKPFWDVLDTIAADNDVSLGDLIETIDLGYRNRADRLEGARNLASCLRVFCLMQTRDPMNSCENYLKETAS